MASTKNTRKRTKKKTSQSKRPKQDNKMKNEILILISLAICIFLQISLFGICGDAGDAFATILFGMFGFMAYITPILLFVGIAFLSQNKKNGRAYVKSFAIFGLYTMCCTVFQLIIYSKDIKTISIKNVYQVTSKNQDGGGVLGASIIKALEPTIGIAGICILIILVSIGLLKY